MYNYIIRCIINGDFKLFYDIMQARSIGTMTEDNMTSIKIFNMTIYITKDYQEMSIKAAEFLATIINENKRPVLGLATGSTMIGLYEEFIRMNQKGEVDFKEVTTFNLDEYYPISKDNSQSYNYFMKERLFNHVNIDISNTYIPNGMAKDIEVECEVFDHQVRETGGFDIQVLGIGSNGHIGFNEPGDSFPVRTHKAELTQRTIKDNSRFFTSIDEMPTRAITMGIGTIMNAKRILLMANGTGKAKIIKDTILGEVTPRVPASILQFHQDLTVILDQAAGAELLKALA